MKFIINNKEINLEKKDLSNLRIDFNNLQEGFVLVKKGVSYRKADLKYIIETLEKAPDEKSKDDIKTNEALKTIKSFLDLLKTKPIYLQTCKLLAHQHKDKHYKHTNYLMESNTLYVDKTIYEPVKEYLETLLASQLTTIKTTHDTIGNHFDIFNHYYHHQPKEKIKNVLKLIPINKLKTLKLHRLQTNKKDKFDKIITTNYHQRLNIIYYLPSDLPIIKEFIYYSKNTYTVKQYQKERKSFIFKNKRYFFNSQSLYKMDNIEYFLDLNGIKYYKIAKIDIKTQQKEVFIINISKDLNQTQFQQIEKIKTELNQRFKPSLYENLKKIILN